MGSLVPYWSWWTCKTKTAMSSITHESHPLKKEKHSHERPQTKPGCGRSSRIFLEPCQSTHEQAQSTSLIELCPFVTVHVCSSNVHMCEKQTSRDVATYMNSVSLMCQGRKPSVLSTGPNFKTSSGSGIFLESGRAQTRHRFSPY